MSEEQVIETSRGTGPGISLEQKTLFDATLEAGTYDVVLAFNILHLVDDAPVVVARAAELLKPAGLLVVALTAAEIG